MSDRRSLALVGMFLAMAPLSGCLDASAGAAERSFDSIAAPTWSPGYSWTYKTTQSVTESGGGGGDGTNQETHSNTVTFTVTNDSQPINGRDVYYVSSSDGIEHPLFPGTQWALAKDDLGLVAYGWDHQMAKMAPTQEICMASPDGGPATCSVSYDARNYDPCDGKTPLEEAEAGEQPTFFRFPLERGRSWGGMWTGEVPAPMQFTAVVHGLSDVVTPAGKLPAVRIAYDFTVTPAASDADVPEGVSIHLHIDNWYSAEVGYLAKSVFQASLRGAPFGGPGGDFAFSSTLELQSYTLEAAAPQPAPPTVAKPDYGAAPEMSPGYRVITDTELPANIAEGPVEVTFGLQPDGAGGYQNYQPPIKVDSVPSTLDFDHATHEVLWVLHQDSQGRTTEHRGDTFTTSLTDGGTHSLHVRILPKECGEPMLGATDTTFGTFWQKTFHLAVEPGPQRTIDVATVAITDSPGQANANWAWKPALAQKLDDGTPLLVAPTGKAADGQAQSNGITWDGLTPGQWKLQWQTKSLTVGDDVDLTLHIDYQTGPYYLPSP